MYQELASILRKTAGVAEVLIEALAPLSDKILLAFVFGSVARGGETAGRRAGCSMRCGLSP